MEGSALLQCRPGTSTRKLQVAWAERHNIDVDSFVSLFDGERLLPGTLKENGVEDGDEILALIHQCGD
jgi:hypothetical protein